MFAIRSRRRPYLVYLAGAFAIPPSKIFSLAGGTNGPLLRWRALGGGSRFAHQGVGHGWIEPVQKLLSVFGWEARMPGTASMPA
jgi:hypothetical protein